MESESAYMSAALHQAEEAAGRGEVPVGAVIVDPVKGEIVSRAGNRSILDHDPTGHAEVLALRSAAASLGNYRLDGLDIYVTLEPCPMCAQAISFARIRRLYYGADDAKGGGVDHGARVFSQTSCHHAPEVYSGISATKSSDLLRDFFSARR